MRPTTEQSLFGPTQSGLRVAYGSERRVTASDSVSTPAGRTQRRWGPSGLVPGVESSLTRGPRPDKAGGTGRRPGGPGRGVGRPPPTGHPTPNPQLHYREPHDDYRHPDHAACGFNLIVCIAILPPTPTPSSIPTSPSLFPSPAAAGQFSPVFPGEGNLNCLYPLLDPLQRGEGKNSMATDGDEIWPHFSGLPHAARWVISFLCAYSFGRQCTQSVLGNS